MYESIKNHVINDALTCVDNLSFCDIYEVESVEIYNQHYFATQQGNISSKIYSQNQ